MGKIVEKKKKKKGRPSLLDLQKRNIREQQEQQQKRHKRKNANTNSAPLPRNNYGTATTSRRSARRNPNPDDDSEEEDEEDHELAGKRREKKLKLVLRLPPGEKPSASQDSGDYDSDAGGDSAADNGSKKRKINAISDGSGNKGDKSISRTNQPNGLQGALKLLDSGPETPLPDKKLLLFVLDRLQKKDTYGVFSDPVDPEELPDYHEVISDPMDFGTVRKKLTSGAYTNLEQFEKDIFLLCSNAMQYNAQDTIYFRQARSIHELAKKNFENLRQDSDDNEPETKIVRRGRPPTKNLKKQIGRPSLESAGLELCESARTSAGENATYSNHDTRKGSHFSDKPGLADSSGRLLGTRNNDVYASWLSDNKYERNDEFTGSGVRGSVKNGIKQEESRRNTYSLSISSAASRESSVLMTFDAERKQLMPVGVLVEHGYPRSLARFASNLGPVAWKVAAKKIERSLPMGVKYGPGWVGENDLPQRKMPIPNSSALPEEPSSNLANPSDVDPKGETAPSTKQPREEDESPQKHAPPSSSAGESPKNITPKPEPLEGSNSQARFSILNSSAVTGVRPKPHFPGMNGFSIAAHMGKLPGLPNGPAAQMLEKCSRNNKSTYNNNNSNNSASNSEDTNKVSENRGTISARNPGFQPRPSWQGPSQQQRPETVPPDLNVRFQSPGSPSSSSRVDSTQPDLALQL